MSHYIFYITVKRCEMHYVPLQRITLVIQRLQLLHVLLLLLLYMFIHNTIQTQI